jgi:hypothetical protein
VTNDLATTLEQCLSQVGSARARVQSCLVSYPSLAPELEPLLRTAEVLRTGPKPELSPEARARIATLAFGTAYLQPRPQHRQRRWRWPAFNPAWGLAALSALLIGTLLVGAGLAYAATDGLPGSALYPVKLATEALWLWVAPRSEEAALHLRFAQRRLEETEALARRGIVEPQVLEAMAGHMDSAFALAQALPPERALPLLQALVALSAAQEEQILGTLLAQLPATAQEHLRAALHVCREQGRRALTALDARQPRPPDSRPLLPTGQEGRPAGNPLPPGQDQVPPAHGIRPPAAEGAGDQGAEEAKEAAEEAKEAAEEEEEAEKEAAEEEKEAEKEAAEEEKEAEEEAAEEQKEAEEEAAEEEKEAAEEEKEAEEEEKEAAEEEREQDQEDREKDREDRSEDKERDREEKEEEVGAIVPANGGGRPAASFTPWAAALSL